MGRVTGGAEVDVDGVGVGVGEGGSAGEEEDATRCRTASRKTSTIFSSGSDKKASIAGSVRGWLDLTF